MHNTVRVWDLPTRIFHWALVGCVLALVVTGKIGGNAIVWHARFGYAVLALLLFRLVWGLVGGRWSRFAAFLYSPASLWRYLRGQAPAAHEMGHTPLGALSVWAMLLVLLAQVGTGLMSDDEISFTGSLVAHVPGDWVSAATRYHKGWGELLVLGLVALHLLAIAFYALVRRQTLVRPMLTGDQSVGDDVPASRDGWAQRALALALAGGCAALAFWVRGLGAPAF